MNITFPFARQFGRDKAQNANDAIDQVRQLAGVPSHAMLPQSKTVALLDIRKDIRHIMSQHEEIASLEGHPGWERLRDIMRRNIISRLRDWRTQLHDDPARLQINEIWADAAETILQIVQTECEQYNDAAQLDTMSDTELVEHSLQKGADEENELQKEVSNE